MTTVPLREDESVRLGLIEALRRSSGRPGPNPPSDDPPPTAASRQAPPRPRPAIPAPGPPGARPVGTPGPMSLETWAPFQVCALALEHARRMAEGAGPTDGGPACLYIHSGSGLGKTHLLSAIASHRGSDVLLANVAQLAAAFGRVERMGSLTHLEDWLTSPRLLLLDDLQACGDSRALQRALQTSIARMLDSGGAVAIAADVPPRGLKRIRGRLRSLVASGEVVELAMGTAAERLDLLRAMRLDLADEVLRPIAESIDDSVTRLKTVAARAARLAQRPQGPEAAAAAEEALLIEAGHSPVSLARPLALAPTRSTEGGLAQLALERFDELERQARSEAEVALALQISIGEQLRSARGAGGAVPGGVEHLQQAIRLTRAGATAAALDVLRRTEPVAMPSPTRPLA